MRLLEQVARELRHATRVLLRTPAFSAIAFVTLALGIGATAAIYSVLDGIVLRPLPYRNADRLVSILHPATVPGNGESKWGLSLGGYFYFKDHNHSFADLGGYRTGSLVVYGDQNAEQARVAIVSASIFTTLGARPAIGRLFSAADDDPGPDPKAQEGNGPKVAILSYEYWQRRFGGDRKVIGTMLRTAAGSRQIVGVAEPGLSLPLPGPFASTSDLASFGVDVWLPLQLNPRATPYNSHQYSGIGRLKPGVTAEVAQRDLANLMRDFPAQMPTAYSERFMREFNFRIGVTPLRDAVLGPTLARSLWILFGAVGVVLLIACANVANLFLVRMEARRRESAVRTALGASRGQMAMFYLAESLTLSLVAGAAGIGIAWAGLRLLVRAAPTDIPRLATVGLSWHAVALVAVLAVAAGLVFGLLPVLRSSVDVSTLREGGRGLTASPRQRAARNGLVIVQVALGLVLLAAAGLMLRSFAHLRSVKTGLDPRGVLTFEAILPYSEFENAPAVAAFEREFAQRVSALPGVVRVGATTSLPLQDFGSGCNGVAREDRPYTADEKGACVPPPPMLPGYLESLGIKVRGRTPTWSDVDEKDSLPTVAVVTQALAQHLWPGEDVIGKGISTGGRWGRAQYWRIIGVIPELRARGLDQPPTEAVFPVEISRDLTWTVKTSRDDPMSLMPTVRRILLDMNPRVPVVNPRTMSDVVARSIARTSFLMMLLAIASTIALVLSAVGIYGVISYLVTQRRPEIGVRIALGARTPQVVSLVLGHAMRLAAIGVAIGLVGALVGTRVLRSLLFDVSPTDPVVLAGTCIVLVAIGAVASIAPARRAAGIDPVEAMR